MRNEAPDGFDGPWPRFQLFHGTTDKILYPSMIDAQVAQWTNVHGLSEEDATSEDDSPKSGWTRKSYKNDSDVVMFEAITGVATGAYEEHDLSGMGFFPDVVQFFGLDMDPPPVDPGGEGGAGGAGEGDGAGGADEAVGGSPEGGNSAGGDDSGGTAGSAGASSSGGSKSSGGSGGSDTTGTGGDSAAPNGVKTPDVGCGCKVAGAGSETLGGLAAFAAGLGMLLRRRQRAGAKRD